MSDANKPGLGLFVNRKSEGAAPSAAGPKNVTKRWMYVGGGILGFSMLAASFFHEAPTAPMAKKKVEASIDVTPPKADQKRWEAESQGDIAALKDAVEKLREDNAKLKDEVKRGGGTAGKQGTAAALPAGVVPPPSPPGTNGNMDSLPPVMPPAPPTPPASMMPRSQGASTPTSFTPSPALPGVALNSSVSKEALVFKAEPVKGAADQKGLDEVKAVVKYKANPYSGMLPAGAFAPISLLNGLDAGTASANQSNPQPVLMNVMEHATLPGAAKYRLKSCFVLASAYGDLSAERVYFRLAQLSCIDKADRLVMTTPVQGYVVDSDGKLGMRGVVADRQGAKLGKALLAGFAQGLGTAFGSAQGSVTSSVLGTATTISGGDALKQSGLTGASTAASQLAQFYLKEAQNIFPVITIDAGRTGSMVFTQGVPLTWGEGDTLYKKDVRPD